MEGDNGSPKGKKDVPRRGGPSAGLRPGKVVFYRGMGEKHGWEVRREYGKPRKIRVDGKLIPVILHEENHWSRLTDPETGTSLTLGCLDDKDAVETARTNIARIGIDAYKAGQAAWKRIVLEGMSISDYARKRTALVPARVEEYRQWATEFRRRAAPAKPAGRSRPNPRNPRPAPKGDR